MLNSKITFKASNKLSINDSAQPWILFCNSHCRIFRRHLKNHYLTLMILTLRGFWPWDLNHHILHLQKCPPNAFHFLGPIVLAHYWHLAWVLQHTGAVRKELWGNYSLRLTFNNRAAIFPEFPVSTATSLSERSFIAQILLVIQNKVWDLASSHCLKIPMYNSLMYKTNSWYHDWLHSWRTKTD